MACRAKCSNQNNDASGHIERAQTEINGFRNQIASSGVTATEDLKDIESSQLRMKNAQTRQQNYMQWSAQMKSVQSNFVEIETFVKEARKSLSEGNMNISELKEYAEAKKVSGTIKLYLTALGLASANINGIEQLVSESQLQATLPLVTGFLEQETRRASDDIGQAQADMERATQNRNHALAQVAAAQQRVTELEAFIQQQEQRKCPPW